MATSMFLRSSSHKCNRFIPLRHKRQLQSLAVEESGDKDAHYPPIKPKYPPGKWGRMPSKIAWMWEGQREKVAALGTVDEKIKFLTETPFRAWNYNSIDTTPNLLKYQCSVTKSGIIRALPELYESITLDEDSYERLKRILIETIIQEHEANRHRFIKAVRQYDTLVGRRLRDTSEYNLSNLIVKSILLNLLGAISGQRQDISESHIDYNSRVSAFWNRHGFLRQKLIVPSKDKNYIRQSNCMFYGEHKVEIQVRKRKPLPQFAPTTPELCRLFSNKNRNLEGFSPKVLGQFMRKITRQVTAGYNIGDPQLFNHLSIIFTNKEKLQRMNQYGEEYKMQADVGYALSTGFLSTLAQAHMLGFNEHEELTYPFTTQTILTDGRKFILSSYQLNTIQLWKDYRTNQLGNFCWITKGEDLYEKYENGQLVGFNDDLFKKLVKFLLIEPCDRNGIDLSPNLKLSAEMLPGMSEEMVTEFNIPNKKVYKIIEEELKYD